MQLEVVCPTKCLELFFLFAFKKECCSKYYIACKGVCLLSYSRGCIKNDHIIECTPRCFQSRQSSYVFWMEKKNLIHNPLLDRGEERIRIECCQSVNNSSSYLDCKMWFVKCQYKCIEKLFAEWKMDHNLFEDTLLRYTDLLVWSFCSCIT